MGEIGHRSPSRRSPRTALAPDRDRVSPRARTMRVDDQSGRPHSRVAGAGLRSGEMAHATVTDEDFGEARRRFLVGLAEATTQTTLRQRWKICTEEQHLPRRGLHGARRRSPGVTDHARDTCIWPKSHVRAGLLNRPVHRMENVVPSWQRPCRHRRGNRFGHPAQSGTRDRHLGAHG